MFFDGTLDDPEALESIDPVLREIATWGAEVRRADAAAADAMAGMAASMEICAARRSTGRSRYRPIAGNRLVKSRICGRFAL
jgi:hypothetical protein